MSPKKNVRFSVRFIGGANIDTNSEKEVPVNKIWKDKKAVI